MYIVSACLLGENCKYNGGNNRCEKVIELVQGRRCVPVCPEVAGGLPVPRAPAEIRNGRICGKDGGDYTEAFVRGAAMEWERCRNEAAEAACDIELAILQPRSPSCGAGRIYDGTFSKALIEGDGVFAALLKEHGIKIISADQQILRRKQEIKAITEEG